VPPDCPGTLQAQRVARVERTVPTRLLDHSFTTPLSESTDIHLARKDHPSSSFEGRTDPGEQRAERLHTFPPSTMYSGAGDLPVAGGDGKSSRRAIRSPITRVASSISSTASTGTTTRRREKKPGRTDRATGCAGEAAGTIPSTRPTTRPRLSTTRNPGNFAPGTPAQSVELCAACRIRGLERSCREGASVTVISTRWTGGRRKTGAAGSAPARSSVGGFRRATVPETRQTHLRCRRLRHRRHKVYHPAGVCSGRA
jgi:hypothetical protein